MFMSDISTIFRKMRVSAERNMNHLGIGFPEQLVLMVLKAHGSSNQDAIAAKLVIDKGAVAKTVAKLESKGLVVREVNPANKREKLVALTSAAAEIIDTMGRQYMELEQTMFAGLEPAEVESLCLQLSRVAANLSEEEDSVEQ